LKTAKSPKKSKHRGLVAAVVLLALIALGLADSRFRIAVTEYELYYDNLPASFDGYRIVQLSDLHMALLDEGGEKLIKIVEERRPDIIVLTGDFLNMRSTQTEGTQTEALRPFLTKLRAVAPCYFVSGNHEWASGEIAQLGTMLDELDIVYLQNEDVLLEKADESIVLAGVEDPNGPADMIKPDEFAENLAQLYPEKFILLLAHRNDWLEKYPNLPVDLILCGHAHGGIIRLPVVGGVFGTNMDLFPKYDAGIYSEGKYDMVLSRGLGGYMSVPRF